MNEWMNGISRQGGGSRSLADTGSAQEYQDNVFLRWAGRVRPNPSSLSYLSELQRCHNQQFVEQPQQEKDEHLMMPTIRQKSRCYCTSKWVWWDKVRYQDIGRVEVGKRFVLCWTYVSKWAISALALRLCRFWIRHSVRSSSALAIPALTVWRQLSRTDASSSKRVQPISHSLSVLLTLFRYVLWLPRFG